MPFWFAHIPSSRISGRGRLETLSGSFEVVSELPGGEQERAADLLTGSRGPVVLAGELLLDIDELFRHRGRRLVLAGGVVLGRAPAQLGAECGGRRVEQCRVSGQELRGESLVAVAIRRRVGECVGDRLDGFDSWSMRSVTGRYLLTGSDFPVTRFRGLNRRLSRPRRLA
jgi:hypothetical protein